MLIEEIIRSCRSESVAEAAVASIGAGFARDIAAAAESQGMSIGGFTARSVERFARVGGEAQMRALVAVMDEAQEPILVGLHRILSVTLRPEADAPITCAQDWRTASQVRTYPEADRRYAQYA